MATKIPLVLGADGLVQQLQSTDTISVPFSGVDVRSVTNSDSVALVFGTPVYAFAAGSVKRGQANAKSTSGVVGLMYDATTAAAAVGQMAAGGVMAGTTAQWDAVTGATGGLVFNTLYFLDPVTAGKLTTAVATTVGQCNALIGRAISTTELEVDISEPVLL